MNPSRTRALHSWFVVPSTTPTKGVRYRSIVANDEERCCLPSPAVRPLQSDDSARLNSPQKLFAAGDKHPIHRGVPYTIGSASNEMSSPTAPNSLPRVPIHARGE